MIKMEKKEKITLFFWLFLSIFFCVESLRLGLGSFIAPGPGFFPFGASLVIGLFTIVLFLKGRGKKLIEHVGPFFQGRNGKNAIYILGALFAYSFLLGILGFFLCTLAFVGFCIKRAGSYKWGTVLWISAVTAIASYLLFISWLDIQIPELKWVTKIFALGGSLWN